MHESKSEYESDFKTTFKLDSRGRVKADIIKVELFIEKYKILIERCTDIYIEPMNVLHCVDFTRRMRRMYTLGCVTNEYINAEKAIGYQLEF